MANNVKSVPGHLTPCGVFQQVSPVAAAQALPSVPEGVCLAVISVEGQPIRYTDDGVTTPTASIGMPLNVGDTLEYAADMINFKMIEQIAGAIVNISYYKNV